MNLLEIKENKNLKIEFSGMDHYDHCSDKEHFKNYNKTISYEYNSAGFRDKEWPIDLKNKIWCIGDSFTVGLGQPAEETWPALLEKKINERCINIGEDGCSNDLMSLRIKHIIDNYNPKTIIVMWSYFWRRLINGKNVLYDANSRELPKDDVNNFLKNFYSVNNYSCKIINLLIPDCFLESPQESVFRKKNKKNIHKILSYADPTFSSNIIEVEQFDYARDGHHFDILTCQNIVKEILKNF